MIALVRTEFTKAAWRTRTLIVSLLLVGLPTLIVVALSTRGDGPAHGDREGVFRLAQQSGFLIPAAVISVMSGFLLVVISGILAGDSVAGDASWGNLRYLLMRPVARGRLLVAKALVAGVLIWAATFLVALAGLAAGLIFFGAHDVTVPGLGALGFGGQGFTLTPGDLLVRLAVATAYVAFSFTALLALGTFFSTLTDTPVSAIGGAIGVYIVSEILDAITEIGRIRSVFPTHYRLAWQTMFTEDAFSRDMITGAVVQLVWLAVFGGAAFVWFRRKDIRS